MELFYAQLISLIVLLVGTFVSGMMPFFLVKASNDGNTSNRKDKILSFLLYLGGGVLMSTCFLHLLPESHGSFEMKPTLAKSSEENNKKKNESITLSHRHTETFPIPEFIVLCGFFITYVIEEIILFFLTRCRKPETSQNDFRIKFCTCAQRHTECSRTFKGEQRNRSILGAENNAFSSPEVSTIGQYTKRSPEDQDDGGLTSIMAHQIVPNYGTVDMNAQEVPIKTISVGSVLTVAALSFHSLFEGFAVGFQDSVSGTWTLLLAISLHKFVVAFVIGIELLSDGALWTHMACYLGAFSIMSPIGTTVAMLAQGSVSQMPPIVIGCVNCIACGTLIYVTFYEILRRSQSEGVHGLTRFLAVALGAGLIAAVQYLTSIFKL